jgi:hypothetical protein
MHYCTWKSVIFSKKKINRMEVFESGIPEKCRCHPVDFPEGEERRAAHGARTVAAGASLDRATRASVGRPDLARQLTFVSRETGRMRQTRRDVGRHISSGTSDATIRAASSRRVEDALNLRSCSEIDPNYRDNQMKPGAATKIKNNLAQREVRRFSYDSGAYV